MHRVRDREHLAKSGWLALRTPLASVYRAAVASVSSSSKRVWIGVAAATGAAVFLGFVFAWWRDASTGEAVPQFADAIADVEERPGIRGLPIDEPVALCAGRVEDRLAVLALDSGARFFDAFPESPPTAELMGAGIELTAVVYRGIWPGAVLSRAGSAPRETTLPGTVDVCVATTGAPSLSGSSYAVYGDAPLEGSVILIR